MKVWERTSTNIGAPASTKTSFKSFKMLTVKMFISLKCKSSNVYKFKMLKVKMFISLKY